MAKQLSRKDHRMDTQMQEPCFTQNDSWKLHGLHYCSLFPSCGDSGKRKTLIYYLPEEQRIPKFPNQRTLSQKATGLAVSSKNTDKNTWETLGSSELTKSLTTWTAFSKNHETQSQLIQKTGTSLCSRVNSSTTLYRTIWSAANILLSHIYLKLEYSSIPALQ